MDRRTWIKTAFLGVAALVTRRIPVPAATIEPRPGATDGLTLAKLVRAREMLDQNVGPWTLPPGYKSQFEAQWREVMARHKAGE